MMPKDIIQKQQPVTLHPNKWENLKKKRLLLQQLLSIANSDIKCQQQQYFLKWKSALITKKIDASRVSLRMKAQILLQSAKFENTTNLHEAFLRWKIRTDPQIVKKAVDQFILYSKINHFNAFQRLKALLPDNKMKKIDKKKKKNLALLNLSLILQKHKFQNYKQAMDEMKPKQSDYKILLAKFLNSICKKQLQKKLHNKFVLWYIKAKAKSQLKERQLKKLQQLGNEYNLKNQKLQQQQLTEAFHKWKGFLSDFRLKKKFFGVLLKTTFGRLQKLYHRWETLPDQKANKKKKTGIVLIQRLQERSIQKIRLAWSSFMAIHDEAKNKKTKVIRELIETSFNQSHTAFYNWANYNTYAKLTETNLKKIKALDATIGVTRQIVKQNTNALFQLCGKGKVLQTLERIIHKINSRQKQDALTNIKNEAVRNKMKKELKNFNQKDIIERLKTSLKQSNRQRLITILDKFRKNCEAYKRKTRQEACIKRMIFLKKHELKEWFDLWKKNAWQLKILDGYSQLNYKLNDEIIKAKLISWINTGSKVRNQSLTLILKKFNQNSQEQGMKKRALKYLENTVVGKVLSSFQKWKQMPQRNQSSRKQGSIFLQQLARLLQNKLKNQSFNQIASIHEDAVAKKKLAILILIKSQQSELSRGMQQYQNNVNLITSVRKCRLTIQFFDQLTKSAQANLSLLKENQNTRKQEKAINTLIKNTTNNLREAFLKWLNSCKVQKLQDSLTIEKKKLLIDAMGLFLKNSKNAQLRLILGKFKKYQGISQIQDKFFRKLLSTRAGGVMSSFQKWKNLPIAVDNDALRKRKRFEKSLEDLVKHSLKKSYNPLKEIHYYGLNQKRLCIRKLFDNTMSSNKRMFLMWVQYNRTAKQILSCKLTVDFFSILNRSATAGVSPVFQNPREAAIKERILAKLISGQQNKMMMAFLLWRNNCAQQRIQDSLNSEKKKLLIEGILKYQQGSQHGLLRQVLQKFSQEAARTRLIREINLKLLRTTQGSVLDAFKKWQSIPEQNLDNFKKGSRFESSLLQYAKKVWRKQTWYPLIEDHEDAQAKQKRAIMLLVKTQESELRRGLSEWNNNVKLQDQVQRCMSVIRLFDQLNKTAKMNVSVIIETQQQRIQERALNKLFQNSQNNLREAFNRWLNSSKVMKLQDAITDEKKKILLDSMNGFLNNSTNAKLRDILAKFKKNSSISSIQDKFFKKLFSTKAGGVINSFQKWKNLPIPKDNEALKKGRKFERSLESIIHHGLKSSFDPMKDIYYEALNQKRACIRKLLDKTMSSNKRMFLMWMQYNRTAKQILSCKLTVDFFSILNRSATAGVSPVFQNPREAAIKDKVLTQLVANQENQLAYAFMYWRNHVAQQRIQDSLNFEKKKLLIEGIFKYQQGSQHGLLRQVLQKFSQEAARTRLIREINLKLLRTTQGSVLDAFKKWQSIPEQNLDNFKKGSRFENSLLQYAKKVWRKQTWYPLIEDHEDAQAKQKRAIMLLVKTQESELRRGLSEWNNNVKLQDQVQRCMSVIRLFDQLNKTAKMNVSVIIETQQQRIQERALNKLFQNSQNNLREAFNRWLNSSKVMKLQEAITDEKKKILLDSMNGFLNNSTNAKLREILAKFKKNSSISSIQDKFFKKLFSTKAGGVINSFQKWKNLPIPKDNEALKKGRKFERSLESIIHHGLKSSFDPMKDIYYEALNQKRACIRKLLDKTMSSNKRMFLMWMQYNRTAKQILSCKLTVDFFSILNRSATAGVSPVFQNPREAAIKDKVLTQLVANQENQLAYAFMYWRNHVAQQRIQDSLNFEKKKLLIEGIFKYQQGSQHGLLRQVLQKFSQEAQRTRLIREINLKLLRTTQGSVLDAFKKWQSIPEQNLDNFKKGSRFENSLLQYAKKVWRKQTWYPLIEDHEDAQAKQKRAIMLLVKTQESELRRGLSEWNNNVKLQDQVQRCMSVIRLFDQLNKTAKMNVSVIIETQQQRIQERALNKLFQNSQNNLREAFNRWLNSSKVMKLQDAITDEKKKILLDSMNGFLNNSTNAKLRDILAKFKKNSSISSIQDKFFKKLFSTKAGGVINSFQKWKNLPIPKDNEALKKGRKFERSLESIIHHGLKSSFDPMKDIYYEALNQKRACIRKLLDKTMSSNKRMFLMWMQYNRTAKQILSCKLTVDFFSILNRSATAGVSPVFQNPREAAIKDKVLTQLVANQENQLAYAFMYWRNHVAQQRIQDSLNFEKKKLLIEGIFKYQQGSQHGLLRQVLQKFSQEAQRTRLIREINLKLLRTTQGSVLDAFKKWQSIPEQNLDNFKKGSRFENSLLQYAKKVWRKQTWYPLIEDHEDAQAKQKRAIMLLVKTQESELRRGLSEWNNNVKLQDQVQRCMSVIRLFDQLNKTAKMNVSVIIETQQQRIQERALNKLFQNSQNNLREAFNRWLNSSKVMKLQDAITDEKKKILLDSMNGFLNNSTNAKLRDILAKFKKNSSISSIQDKFFKKLFSTKAGGVINSFQKWKNLPIPKDNEALKKGRKFERSLESIIHHGLKSSFDPMKDIYYEALNQKRACIRKLLDKTMSSNKRMFLMWMQYNRTAKQILSCKLTVDFFSILNRSATAGVSPVFQNPREAAIKDKVLTQLVANQENQLAYAFMYWRNHVAQQRIQDSLNFEKKKLLIEGIFKYQQGSQHGLLRQVLQKFSQEAARTRLIREINLKLLRTTQGSVLDAFKKWQSIPEQNLDNFKKGSRFENSLLQYAKKVWRKQTWYPLIEDHEDAQAKQKRAILLLVKTQESELRRSLSEWNNNVKLQDQVQRCMSVIRLFDQLNKTAKMNVSVIIETQQQRIQERALNKLFQNSQNNLREAFNRWLNSSKVMKLQDAITDEKKKILLDSMNGFLNNSTNAKLRDILAKFKKNSSISSIQDKFFKKLFSTKAGGVINSFQKWKNLPIPKDNEALKKGRKFERSLESIIHHGLKSSFDPMKDIYYEALNQKRACIRKLLDKTMSSNKRMFLMWMQYNRTAKQILSCKLTVDFFSILNRSATAGVSPVFQNPREAAIKDKVLTQLVANQENQLAYAFMYWRNHVAQQRIQDSLNFEKKKLLIEGIFKYQQGSQHGLLRQVLQKFSQEAARTRLIREINLKLLRTTQGSVLDAFKKWQSIPEQNLDNFKKGSRFENSLLQYAKKVWRKQTWYPLIEDHEDAQAKQKRAILLLVKTQESELRRSLSEWNNNVKLQDQVQRCMSVIRLFDQLNKTAKMNVSVIIETQQQRIQERALNKLFQNSQNNLREAFNRWLNSSKVMKLQDAITDEKKKILLDSMNGFLNNSTNAKLREILAKFKKNSSISSIQDKFFKKLFSTKAGGVINSFQKWKNLPIPKDNEALKKGRKFERSLESIIHHGLKSSFDPMKDIYYEALNQKRACIRKLLDKTMSSNKRMFLMWMQYNRTAKQILSCKLTVDFFSILNRSATAGVSPVFQNPREAAIKERILAKLISGQQNKMMMAFLLWRNNCAQLRIQDSLNSEKKKLLIEGIFKYQQGSQHGLLRQVLQKFSQEAARTRLIREINLKLLRTTQGSVLDAFKKWQSIPEQNLDNFKKGSRFENSLLQYAKKVWRKQTWYPLIEDHEDAQAKQKRAILLLVKTQESELRRSLSEWNNNVKLQDQVQRCMLVIRLFDQLNKTAKMNVSVIIETQQQRIQERALNKLFQNSQNNLREAFNRWLNSSKVMKLQDAITDEKKKILLDSMNGFLNNSTNAKLRDILAKFKKNSSISSIQDKFFKKLFSTKAGGVINSFQKWKNLPIPKDNEALKKGRKFERSLESIIHHGLKSSFDPMKDIYYEALNQKRACIRKLLDKTMSSNKRMFLMWMQYNRTAKQILSCKLTVDFFSILNRSATAGVSPVFQNPREAAIKDKVLTQLVANQENQLAYAFMYWRNHVAQQRIQDSLNFEKKKLLIEGIFKYQQGSQHGLLRQVLQKFSQEAARTRLIREINLKLLRTTQGSVLDAFKKWQSIPEQNLDNFKKGSRFENSLLQYAKKVWRKQTWYPLIEDHEDAQAKQKRAILLLVKTQESELRRSLSEWNNNVKLQDQVQRCMSVIRLFDQLNKTAKMNVSVIIETQQQRIQERALNKLFQNSQNNLREAFNRWLNSSKVMKLQDAITDEKKKILLDSMNGFLNNSTNAKLREILAKFKKNSSISSIQDKFFKKLFSTKAGGVINSFQKWKNLPIPKDNEALKKGRKFERSLESIIHHGLKSSFDPMKDIYYEALNQKRACIRKLLDKTMSSNKRMFLMWMQYNRTAKQILSCKLTVDFFSILNRSATAGVSPVFQNPREAAIKERILAKLISGQQNKMMMAFLLWRNNCAQQRIQDSLNSEKKKLLIEGIFKYQQGSQNGLLRQVLQKFSQEAARTRLIREINLKLLRTTQGSVLDAFKKWQSIPEQNLDNFKKGSRFENSLLQYAKKVWRKQTWYPLIEDHEDAQAKQKRAILLLVKTQESELRRSLSEWNNNVKLQDQVQRCMLVIRLFDQLNKTAKMNVSVIIETQQQRIQERALNKLFQNSQNNLREAFNRWLNSSKVMKLQDAITDEKKKILLDSMNGFLNNSTNAKLRDILAKFKKNSSISSIQDKFFKKLFSTKAGGVINSFQKWKNLPIPKDNEALKKGRKFERSLESIIHHGLKSSFDPMKDIYYEALNQKRACVRKLLDKTMSSNKRMFLMWMQYNRTAKQILSCKLTVDFFSILNRSATAGVSPVFQNPREAAIKDKVLTQLVANQENQLAYAFMYWRNHVAQQRIQDSLNSEKKKLLIEGIFKYQQGSQHGLLRQVLQKFSQEAARTRLIREINLKLLRTTQGSVLDAFKKWQSIPEQNLDNFKKGSRFENSLLQYAKKVWRKQTWYPLIEDHEDAQAKQKRAIMLLVKTQESELRRGLSEWNNNVKLQDQVQRCMSVIRLFDQLNKTAKMNVSVIIETQQQRIQERALNKLFQNSQNNLREAFNRWLNSSKVMKLQDAITDEKKKILLDSMNGFLNNSTNAKLRDILAKFKKNSSISSIQDKFFKKLFSTKAGGVINSFQKWKNLPIPKDNEALKKGRKFERSLESIIHHGLKSSFDPMKDIYYEALNQKRACIRKLLDKTMSSNKRMFLMWMQYNRTAKQILSCKLTVDFFSILNRSATAGVSPVFQNPREVAIKERILAKLISGQQNKMMMAFLLWRNNCAQQRIQDSLNSEKKKLLIEGIFKYQQGSQHGLLRQVLQKFSQEAARTRLIREINLKLLRTTQGSVLDAFKKWQSIPEQNLDNFKKGSRFESSLLQYAKKVWRKQTWYPLIEDHEDAQAKQKRAILLLVKTQESELRRSLSEWNNNVKLQDQVQRCMLVIRLFDQLNKTAKMNVSVIIETQQQRIQERALNKLFQNSQNNLREAFNRWLNSSKVMKLQDAITDEKKKILLDSMNGFLNNSTNAKLRDILAKFKKNSSISSIQDKFFKKLFSTKAGGVINSFQKWKNLPIPKDNEALKKGRKFERSLESIIHHGLKSSFDPMKDIYYEALNQKRACIRKLLDKTMSSNKRMFLMWMQYNRTAKQILSCKLTVDFFSILNRSATAGVSPVFQNPREAAIKDKVLTQLVANQENQLAYAFMYWRNHVAQQRIQDSLNFEKKKLLIEGIFKYQQGSQHGLLRQVLQKFSQGAARTRLIREINLKLLRTTQGSVLDAFKKWQSIPEQNLDNFKKGSRFENSLLQYAKKVWRKQTWYPLIEDHEDAQAKQKRAIMLLVKTQESELRRGLSEWNNNVKLQDQVQRCMSVIRLFDQLNKTAKMNVSVIIETQQQRIQERALNKLFQNSQNNLREAFNRWLNSSKVMKLQDAITDEKKKILLDSMNGFLNNSTNAKLREILAKFKKNSSISSIQDKFFKKLFSTKAGGVINSFQKWKNLPIPKDNEALKKGRKFERSLESIIHHGLKSSFDPMKDIYYEALNQKRACIRKLLDKTMSSNKRMFLMWVQYNRTAKQILSCKLTVDFFSILNRSATAGVSPVFQNPREAAIKERILAKLISGQQNKMMMAFLLWRNNCAQQRIQDSLNSEKKKLLIEGIFKYQQGSQHGLLRQVLQKFSQEAARTRLIREINLKLLRTTQGSVLDAFKKWQSIPEQNLDNFKKGSRFENSLLQYAKKVWRKQTWYPLIEDHEDAQAKQKRAIMLLVKTQESELRRSLSEWNNNVKLQDQVQRCMLVIRLFDQLNKTAKMNVSVIIETQQQRIQEKALNKLFQNSQNNLREAFNRWLNSSKVMKLQDAITDEKKKILLDSMNGFLNNSTNAKLREILAKFKKNSSISSIQDKFFKKLFSTKAGGVINSFQKWKNLPIPKDNEALKKGRKFERSLESIIHHGLKSSFDPMKEIYYEALNQKRACIRKILTNTMSANKRMFLAWAQKTQRYKIDLKYSKVIRLFDSCNKIQQHQFYPLIKDAITDQRKIDELKKLLQDWEAMFNDSYQKWQETQIKLQLLTKQLKDQKIINILKTLTEYCTDRKTYNLRLILKKFNQNTRINTINKRFFQSILRTRIGSLQDSFAKWQSIPQDNSNMLKGSKFEISLQKLIKKGVKSSFDQMKEINFYGLNIKQRTIKLLINKQENGIASAFTKWRVYNTNVKESLRCKAILNLYQQLQSKTSESLNDLRPLDDSSKRKLVVQLLYQHKLSQINQAFREWRAANRQQDVNFESDEQKRQRILRMAVLLIRDYRQGVLRGYLNKWRTHNIKEKVLIRCLGIQKMLHLNRFAERAVKLYVFQKWRIPRNDNPWFKRVAQVLAKNSRITNQISFWRMRDNAFSTGASMNTLKIIKCKKLFNNLRKAYDRTLTKAFMSIEHFGRPNSESSFQPSQNSFFQQTPIRDTLFTRSQGDSQIQKQSQLLSIHTMVRILKQQLRQVFTTFVLNGSQSQLIQHSLLRSSISSAQYKQIHKQMAAEKLINVVEKNVKLKKVVFFGCSSNSQSSDPQLLSRMNNLVIENKSLRKELSELETSKTTFNSTLNAKDKLIRDLNSRLDRIMAQKLAKALTNYQDHLLDDGFDKLYDLE